jgi:hypothetical protein
VPGWQGRAMGPQKKQVRCGVHHLCSQRHFRHHSTQSYVVASALVTPLGPWRRINGNAQGRIARIPTAYRSSHRPACYVATRRLA